MLKFVPHPDIKLIDLPLIEGNLGAEAFKEFMDQFAAALDEIAKKRDKNESRECEFQPLLGWRKKNFFSSKNPLPGERAKMRLVYKVDEQNQKLFVLTVGFRIAQKPVHPDDVYQRVKARDQSEF